MRLLPLYRWVWVLLSLGMVVGCRTSMPSAGCYARYGITDPGSSSPSATSFESSSLLKPPLYSALLEFTLPLGDLHYCQALIKFTSLPRQDVLAGSVVMNAELVSSRRCLSAVHPASESQRLLMWVQKEEGESSSLREDTEGYLVFDLTSQELSDFATARKQLIEKRGEAVASSWKEALWRGSAQRYFALFLEGETPGPSFQGPGASQDLNLGACSLEVAEESLEYKALVGALEKKDHQVGCVSFAELLRFSVQLDVTEEKLKRLSENAHPLLQGVEVASKNQETPTPSPSVALLSSQTQLWQQLGEDATLNAENFASSWFQRPYAVSYFKQRYKEWQDSIQGGGSQGLVLAALSSGSEPASLQPLKEGGFSWEATAFGGVIRGPLKLWQDGGVVADPFVLVKGKPWGVIVSVDHKVMSAASRFSIQGKILVDTPGFESPPASTLDLRDPAMSLLGGDPCKAESPVAQ